MALVLIAVLLLCALFSASPSSARSSPAPTTRAQRSPLSEPIPPLCAEAPYLADEFSARSAKKQIFYRFTGLPSDYPLPGLLWKTMRAEAIAMPLDYVGFWDQQYAVFVSDGIQKQTWVFQSTERDEPVAVLAGYVTSSLNPDAYEVWKFLKHWAKCRGVIHRLPETADSWVDYSSERSMRFGMISGSHQVAARRQALDRGIPVGVILCADGPPC